MVQGHPRSQHRGQNSGDRGKASGRHAAQQRQLRGRYQVDNCAADRRAGLRLLCSWPRQLTTGVS